MMILDAPETSCPYAVGTLCLVVGASNAASPIGRTCVIVRAYGLYPIAARVAGELRSGLSWSYIVRVGGCEWSARHAHLRPIVPPQPAAELRDEPAADRVPA